MYIDTTKSFYKIEKNDKTMWVNDPNRIGIREFSFDGVKIYNLYTDYPNSLSKEEKEIFDKENEFWVDYFSHKLKNKVR